MKTPNAQTPVLSVVIPMHNEAEVLDALFARLLGVLDGTGESYEVICVNDGSLDDTEARLLAKRETVPQLRVLSLSRSFGKEHALSAGLDVTRGDAAIVMDADLQDVPEAIPDFIAKWREGFDVVYGVHDIQPSYGPVRKWLSTSFYRFYNHLAEAPIPERAGDFRLMDRRVVEAIRALPEGQRFMKGLFAWVGFRQTGVAYVREDRSAGQTKWNLWRLWNFALDGITGFSTMPLRLWSYLGALIAFVALLYASFLVIRTLVEGVDVPGYASLMVVVLFLGGVQLITLGVIGEYLGRLYRETKRRPVYIVRDAWGFDDERPKPKAKPRPQKTS